MPVAGTVTPAPLTSLATLIPVSATLAANEALDLRRRRGQPVLPLAFGEAGLPVAEPLRAALSAATASNGYGPVAGLPALRAAAAGYWSRRDLPTGPDAVVCGPGSKALIYGLLMAIGSDVAVPRPSWVTYAAQAGLLGTGARFVPTPAGQGGVPDPAALDAAARAAADAGRPIRSVILTLPDNPTGTLAKPETIREVCRVAEEHDLIIIADEIYRDLVHDPDQAFASPVLFAPERTVVTTALSKSLALGGWRIGVARLPGSPIGLALRDRLVGIGSEIWSAPSLPIQQAAALAFDEPPELLERISRSRALHAEVAVGVADRFAAAGLLVRAPQAAFYLYPDFAPWREHLRTSRGISNGPDLATHLLHCYGMGVLPARAFGEEPEVLRMRVATAMLYGETDEQRERALLSDDPVTLPWIAAALDQIEDVLADLDP